MSNELIGLDWNYRSVCSVGLSSLIGSAMTLWLGSLAF